MKLSTNQGSQRMRVGVGLGVVLLTVGSYFFSRWSDRDVRKCGEEADPTLSIQYCSKVIESGKLSQEQLPITLVDRAAAYVDAGQYDRAMQDVNEAMRLKPELPRAFGVRGRAYIHKDQPDQAIQDFTDAIRLNPSYANAFFLRGMLYVDKKRYEWAIQDFQEAIRLKPFDFRSFAGRGSAYSGKGDDLSAIKDFDHAVKLKPQAAFPYIQRGSFYLKRANLERARQDYEQAVKLDPQQSPSLFSTLGFLQFVTGDLHSAVSSLDRAIQLRPSDPYAIILLYLAQTRSGLDGSDGLSKNALHVAGDVWPRPVISMFEGKIAPEAVLQAARNSDPTKELEQQCEAYFYVAEYWLMQGRKEDAARMLHRAVETKLTELTEYDMAKAELGRLGSAMQ
jgi:lipoprotein NlpI